MRRRNGSVSPDGISNPNSTLDSRWHEATGQMEVLTLERRRDLLKATRPLGTSQLCLDQNSFHGTKMFFQGPGGGWEATQEVGLCALPWETAKSCG